MKISPSPRIRSVVLATAVFVSTLFASFASSAPAHAWTPESQRLIGEQAARLTPPDLYRQLVRNRSAYRLGLEEPFRTAPQGDRYVYANGQGRLDEVIGIAIDHAIAAIRSHRPFNDVAYRMGIVAHFLTLANNPVYVAHGDREQTRWAADYLRYAESVAPRVKTVFYGFRDDFSRDRLLRETLDRGRSLYPMLGREYRRIGFESGLRGFDDRSTAYAVAALGYSHAVSDIAEVLRYIWLEAGGIDARSRLPERGRQIVHLGPLVHEAR